MLSEKAPQRRANAMILYLLRLAHLVCGDRSQIQGWNRTLKTKGHKEIFHEDRNVTLSKLTKLNVRPVYFIVF